ncbi:MAG: HDIG domain-containing protein [Phycisphaerae bacterium]|nr:HDIG domain-containing protein [Gemmatimonadaceae bacterium]
MSHPSRADTLALMQAWTAGDSLRKHMLAVESAMRFCAAKLGQDVEAWGTAGLIHDFDYERFPNAALSADEEHPAEGVRHLRERGYSDEICDAVLGHAHYTGVPRISLMSRALFACDELTGLITASTLVKPSRNIADVDVPGIRKKMKDKAFARGVNRDDVVQGAEALGVPLDEHIAAVLQAMQGSADILGLDGRLGVVPAADPTVTAAAPSSGAASTPVSRDA